MDENFIEYMKTLSEQLGEVTACLTGDRPKNWLKNEVDGLQRIGLEQLIKWLDDFEEGEG